jgi:hypothetical protein
VSAPWDECGGGGDRRPVDERKQDWLAWERENRRHNKMTMKDNLRRVDTRCQRPGMSVEEEETADLWMKGNWKR